MDFAHALMDNAIGCEEKPGVTEPTKTPRSRRAEAADRLTFEIGYTSGDGMLQVASTSVKRIKQNRFANKTRKRIMVA